MVVAQVRAVEGQCTVRSDNESTIIFLVTSYICRRVVNISIPTVQHVQPPSHIAVACPYLVKNSGELALSSPLQYIERANWAMNLRTIFFTSEENTAFNYVIEPRLQLNHPTTPRGGNEFEAW